MPKKPQRRAGRYAWIALCSLLPLAWCSSSACAASIGKADTSRSARNEAAAAVPFERMTPAAQARLRKIVERPSLYRRLPTQRIECDSDMHLFLLRYPEVIVNMWTKMGITKLDMTRQDRHRIRAADGAGTICEVELIYGTPNLHVLYAEGVYEGSVFRRDIRANCVCLVRTEYARGKNQEIIVTDVLDIFVQFDGLAAELLAKTVQPLITSAADHNFAEAMRFVSRINDAAERNGPGVQRLSERLEKVDPEVRKRFAQVTEVVYQRAMMREAAAQLSTAGGRPAARSAMNTD